MSFHQASVEILDSLTVFLQCLHSLAQLLFKSIDLHRLINNYLSFFPEHLQTFFVPLLYAFNFAISFSDDALYFSDLLLELLFVILQLLLLLLLLF